jgi:hypothetical protein
VASAHSSLLGEIQAFPEGGFKHLDNLLLTSSAASLTPVKSSEPQSGASLLVQEMVVQDIASFDRGELRQTETQEPLSGAALARKEMEAKSLNAEVTSFDKAVLKETEVEERNVLPDQSDIKAEREKVELIGGIENFDVDNLARVSVKEPLSGAELVRQELGHQAVQLQIGAFDQTGLKATEVKDGSWLPDQKDISEEKEKVDHLAKIETFDTEGLHKVKTLEPLSGAELLKREITLKAVTEELGSFDVGTMRTTEVEEKNVLPDTAVLAEEKTRESLLAGVEQFPHDSLAHVKAPEPVSGAELLQQELTIKSITTFDSSVLRAATTSERMVLPDAETLASERERAGLLSALQAPRDLTPVTPKEPLGGAELARQELTRQQVMESVATFDPEGLKHSEVQERALLPDLSSIEQERSHVQHLAGIGTFDQSVLAPVKVAEPLSGPEVTRQESLREGISTELASFDKGELRETEVEEKGVLPGSEDIQAERQHMEHMQGLESGLQLRSTQTREPSSPLDLARLELNKDQMEEELQAFNR